MHSCLSNAVQTCAFAPTTRGTVPSKEPAASRAHFCPSTHSSRPSTVQSHQALLCCPPDVGCSARPRQEDAGKALLHPSAAGIQRSLGVLCEAGTPGGRAGEGFPAAGWTHGGDGC